MKIKNYITIFLAVIAIIALLGLAGYMTYLNTDDSNPFKQTVTSVIEDANLQFGLGIDFDKLTHPIPMSKNGSMPVKLPELPKLPQLPKLSLPKLPKLPIP